MIDTISNVGAAPLQSVELIANAVPGAPVVGAFSSLGWEKFAAPMIGGPQADHFYAGPGGELDRVVAALIAEVGLRPVRVADRARLALLENLRAPWFTLVHQPGRSRYLAFKMISG